MKSETPREQYDRGVSLRIIQHRFHMSPGELREMAPEEFEDDNPEPESDIGGY